MSQEYEILNESVVLKNVASYDIFYDEKIKSPRQDISSLVQMIVKLLGGDILDDPIQDFELSRQQLIVCYMFDICVDLLLFLAINEYFKLIILFFFRKLLDTKR